VPGDGCANNDTPNEDNGVARFLTMITIPTEIVDHIFSFLDVLSPSGYNDLKACARAHPFLLTSAERCLFSNIRISRNPTVGRAFHCSNLSNVLLTKPHIANYVRALGVDLSSSPLDCHTVAPRELEDMLFVISKLRALTTIEIRGHHYWKNIEWSWLHKPFREAFINCLSLPSIKKVSILRMDDFPMTAFDQCKGLTELSLDGKFELSTDLCPRLESLSIYYWFKSGIFPGIITWKNALNLRRLDVCIPGVGELALFSDVIRICSAITDLGLDFLDKCNFFSFFHFFASFHT